MARKANFSQGTYTVRNPNKYVGNGVPRYRSSWELAFMNFCDNNNNVLQWASESIKIPYRNPITGKQTIYVPDFFIVYRDKNNTQKAELIEIKPKGQSVIESKMSNNNKATVVVNMAKWEAARAWCNRNGITFRVITEEQMFRK